MALVGKAPDSLENLRDIQEERFQYQMDLVFKAHPFYKEAFKQKNLSRSDIKSLADLSKLPLTRKEDYISRPEEFCLQLEEVQGISREERTIWDIVYTAGSTHDPTPFYDTCYDHYARISQLKRTAELLGVTEPGYHHQSVSAHFRAPSRIPECSVGQPIYRRQTRVKFRRELRWGIWRSQALHPGHGDG